MRPLVYKVTKEILERDAVVLLLLLPNVLDRWLPGPIFQISLPASVPWVIPGLFAGEVEIKKYGFNELEQVEAKEERLTLSLACRQIRGRILKDFLVQNTQIGGGSQSVHQFGVRVRV